MKTFLVPFGMGNLGKNAGVETAPKKIAPRAKKLEFNAQNVGQGLADIEKEALKIKGKSVFVGGDHQVSYALVRAFAKKRKNFSLVVFDAHPDCMDFFVPPSHEDWLRSLVEEKTVRPENILLLGVRKIHPIERKFLKRKKIAFLSPKQALQGKKLGEFLHRAERIYVSFDIDVFDAKLVPGTGYPEQNGFSEREGLGLLKSVLDSGKVKMADLVEANPLKDRQGKTIRLAKKVLQLF
ncbi:MAG: arginase family protein [Candidatus Diapherotrites archaeon]